MASVAMRVRFGSVGGHGRLPRGRVAVLCLPATAVAHFSPEVMFLLFSSGYRERKYFGKKKMLLEIAATYVLGKCDSRVTQ